jgi:Anti-sigma-K factor rskA
VDSSSHSSEDVLNELDPLSRALLDLSVQRGMGDAEIAQVLGTDEDSVFEVRVGLLRNLAERVAPEHAEAELPELQAAVTERLYPEDEPAVAAEPEAKLEPEPELETEPEPEPDPETAPAPAPPRRERRSPFLYLLPVLALLAAVGLIVALSSGGGDDESSEQATQRAPDKAPEPKAETIRLTTVGSGRAGGTATLTGDRLQLTLRNLPAPGDGVYTVWLYNSLIDAKQLSTVKGSKVTVTLPKDADKYEFLDVSLEPRDGNPNHSGQSVLRAPLSKLEQSAG